MYVLDAQRRLIYANGALLSWLGCTAESVHGRPCLYHGFDEQLPLGQVPLQGLAPPALASPPTITTGVVFADRLGRPREYRRAVFVPLAAESPGSVWVAVESQACRSEPNHQQGPPDHPERLHIELSRFRLEAFGDFALKRLVGVSPASCRVRRQVELAIAGDSSVVVVGRPGSGREHVARTIHIASHPAKAGPLVPLACGLLDRELLQSTRQSMVRSENRQTGTAIVLLDVDQLAADVQGEILDWIDGDERPGRVLSTARCRLSHLVERHQMLAELAERLATLEICLPALTERREDIPLLAQAAIERLNAQGRKQLSGLHPTALDRLVGYGWQGDIDELMSVVEQAAQASSGPVIGPGDLPSYLELAGRAAQAEAPQPPRTVVLDQYLEDLEKQMIHQILEDCRGNKSQAARRLGISRARLIRRIAQLRLEDVP
jgi:transcriptional regulator of acetoin/glycerol metabolism